MWKGKRFSALSRDQPALSVMRVVIPARVVQFAFGVFYTWGVVVPFVRQYNHWSPLVISAVFSGVSFGYGLGIIVAGWLATATRRACCAGLP